MNDRPEEYWKELAELRGRLISALMTGNTPVAGVLIQQLKNYEDGVPNQPVILEDDKKQNLRDSFVRLEKAVKAIIE